MSKKKIRVMCSAFRDGFQSVFGARVFTRDFMPAVRAAREAGINYFEAGGGARFQSLYFYCNEDAFEMMESFREAAGPDATLQTLARGVNVVGLESQSSDIIALHARLFQKHGIDTIRNFDALNDVNNLIYSGKCIVDAGLKHQVCITMMQLPPGCEGAHDPEFYEMTLRRILDSGLPFDSICFKDASGTCVPDTVYKTIVRARKMVGEDVLIHFHTHETAGISVAANQAAIHAGADAIDLSLAPCSGGTCQPDVITMWHALRRTGYELQVDVEKVREAEEVFKECMKEYYLPPEATRVEPQIPWSPMPGGALTANTQMLRDNGIMDRYPEIIRAMGEVVRKGGYGTSVTPVSQFYFQQAFNNVLFGDWEKVAPDYGKMVLGYYGKTPMEPDPEIVKLARAQLDKEKTDRTPREINDADETKGIAHATKLLKENRLPVTDENVFIVATCKDKGITFLKGEATIGVRKKSSAPDTPSEEDGGEYILRVDGREYRVVVANGSVTLDGKTYSADLRAAETPVRQEKKTGKEDSPTREMAVKSPMPAKVFKLGPAPGEQVSKGDLILVLEAMKMENKIYSPASGRIGEYQVKVGDQITSGQTLVQIHT